MGVCRRLHRLLLGVLLLFLFSRVVVLLRLLVVLGHPSTEARLRPGALQDSLRAKPFRLQPLENCQEFSREARPSIGSLLYHLKATRGDDLEETLSCPRGLRPNIGFLLASISLKPAASDVSRATRAGWLGERHGSCVCSRARLQAQTPPKPPLCALPRTVRASRLMMPSAAYAEWNLPGDSRGQTNNRAEALRSGEHSDSTVSLNVRAATTPPGPAQNDERFEGHWYAGNRGATAAAFGRLLERARLLQSVASGLFCVLPLGFRVMRKIEAVCHEELEMAGATPLSLPNVMPLEWICNSKRITSFGSSLYKLHDRRGRELFLPPTSEEAAAWLAATNIRSHRDLPLIFYQIGQKFRDELRPRAGCLRTREFVMLEAYSFHQQATCREVSYHVMDKCFRRILARVGAASVHRIEADPGAMGGCCSHEYHVSHDSLKQLRCLMNQVFKVAIAPATLSLQGNDDMHARILLRSLQVPSLLGEDVTQGLAAYGAENIGRSSEGGLIQECGSVGRSLEVGHCFQLPATYCEAAKARFADSSGAVKVPLMNSYGLGVSRLFGHLVLIYQDAKGLRLPPQVAPFFVAVLLQSAQRWSASRRVARVGEALFKKLGQFVKEAGSSADALLDDRRGIALRQMQAHADLLGIPHQILVKEELLRPPGPARVLYVKRSSGKMEVQTLGTALRAIKRALLQLASPS